MLRTTLPPHIDYHGVCESPCDARRRLVARSVDYDEVSGTLDLPYVSEDVENSEYEIKLTAKDAKDDSHKKAMRYLQKELPALKESLKLFTKEIYAK
jgi:hypothetical protein